MRCERNKGESYQCRSSTTEDLAHCFQHRIHDPLWTRERAIENQRGRSITDAEADAALARIKAEA